MPAFQELQALIRLIINGIIWGGEGEGQHAAQSFSFLTTVVQASLERLQSAQESQTGRASQLDWGGVEWGGVGRGAAVRMLHTRATSHLECSP